MSETIAAGDVADQPEAGVGVGIELTGLEILWTARATQAEAAGGRVVLLEEEMLDLRGLDAVTGREIWKTRFQEEAWGAHLLFPVGSRVLVYAGSRLHAVDAATGEVVGRHPVPLKEDIRSGCWVGHERGACALVCDCSFQFIDCTTGAPIGTDHRIEPVEEADLSGGPPSRGCWGERGQVLGRFGDNLVATVPGELYRLPRTEEEARALAGARPDALIAVDAATGEEAWRSTESFLGSWAPYASGAAPDGRTCWLGDSMGTALRVFDCASGAPLWKLDREYVPETSHRDTGAATIATAAVWVPDPRGIFVLDASTHTARLLDERTGAPLWSRTPAEGAFALPSGVGVYALVPFLHGPGALEILAPRDGSVAATVPVPEDASLQEDPGGGFVILGPELIACDAAGVEQARRPWTGPPNLAIAAGLVVAFSDTETVVLDRTTLRTLGSFRGEYGVVGLGRLPEPGMLLLYRYGTAAAGQLIALRVAPE